MPVIGDEIPINTPTQAGKIEVPTVKAEPKIVSKRAVDKSADEIKAKRALPPIPGKNVDFDSMQSWLKLLTEDMWKHVIIYVYRHDPIIDNSLLLGAEASKYIDVLGCPFDEEYMINRHGGGKYGFYITDNDLSKGQGLFESRLTIPVTQYDPKIDIRTLDVNHKDNRRWILFYRQNGQLDKDGKPVDTKKETTTSVNGVGTEIANAVLAGIDKASQIYNRTQPRNGGNDSELGNTIGTILVEKMKQDDPNKSIESFAKLAGMFKQGDNSQIFTVMMTMFEKMQTTMMESQRENTKIMFESLKEIKRQDRDKDDEGEKVSPISQLKELLEVGEQLGIKVGGRPGPRSGWDTAMEVASTLGPPVFNLVSQILQASMLSKQAGLAGVPQPLATPPASPCVQQPTLAPPIPINSYTAMGRNANPSPEEKLPPPESNSVSPVSSPPESSIPAITPDAIITSPQIQEIQLLLRTAGGLIQKQIMDGVKGYDFAETLVKMYGVANHARVAKHGVEVVVEAMKTVPEFWKPLDDAFGEEYIGNWVGEFINYEAIIARMEAEEMGDDFDLDDPEDNEPQQTMPIGGKKK